MQYSIKQAAILLKQGYAIFDDNSDNKTLKKVLEKALPDKKISVRYVSPKRYFYINERDFFFQVNVPDNKEGILLSEITKKPKMKPETFTISKADYDKFKQFELNSLYAKSEPERRLSRDEFACSVMNGLYSNGIKQTDDLDLMEDVKLFYRIADAMIKQRDL